MYGQQQPYADPLRRAGAAQPPVERVIRLVTATAVARVYAGYDDRPLMRSLAHVGIKHANSLPVRLVFVDELLMPRGVLIGVVRFAGVENHVERDVVVRLIHGARQIGNKRSRSEENCS